MRILVLGAGGHGQVVVDILLRMADAGADLTVAGYLDDNTALKGQRPLNVPILGRLSDRASVPHDAVIVAVGNNHQRFRLATELAREGEAFALACHPRAVIAPDVTFGPGSMVCGGVVVNPGSVIGAHAILNTGCTVDHHNRIGDFAHIAPGVHLGGDVQVGQGTLVGIGSSILPQLSVGDWAIVGAGSVVTRNVPSRVTATGAPARSRLMGGGTQRRR
jgi:sugar O-acyltransferase (sialic acid O-acetyltransferase NeuD family)